jgi:hypothetical protein
MSLNGIGPITARRTEVSPSSLGGYKDEGPPIPITPEGYSTDDITAVMYPDGRIYCPQVGDIREDKLGPYGETFENEDRFLAFLRKPRRD